MELTCKTSQQFGYVSIHILLHILVLLHVNNFFLGFMFACLDFARIFIRGSLIPRFFYNREKHEI